MLVNITINSRVYTSYASVEEANIALAVYPAREETWSALSDDEKGIRLVAASNRLDLFTWRGAKDNDSQLREWPRTVSVTIPPAIKAATYLLAAAIASDAQASEVGEASSRNISEVRAGSAVVKYGVTQAAAAIDQLRSDLGDDTVYTLIRPWLAGSTAYGVGLASGTDAKSSFEDPYDRLGPFS